VAVPHFSVAFVRAASGPQRRLLVGRATAIVPGWEYERSESHLITPAKQGLLHEEFVHTSRRAGMVCGR